MLDIYLLLPFTITIMLSRNGDQQEMQVITQELKLQRASDHNIKLELKLYRKRDMFHSLQSPPSLKHTLHTCYPPARWD